jgi:PelA/Pel-15E family pectate lyase
MIGTFDPGSFTSAYREPVGMKSDARLFPVLGIASAIGVILALATIAFAQERSGSTVRWRNILEQPSQWYSTADAARIADNVLLYQHENGGWPKNIDMARTLSDADKEHLRATRNQAETTIDNGATNTQIRFLALVHEATGDDRLADAARRGIEYLLKAQYENGGWPQFYPLIDGYYTHITFNDGAMIGTMRVLRDAASGKPPYEFVDDDLRERSRRAIEKGLDVVLKCQIVVDGHLTAWCAQHDEVDFRPRNARTYELASLSGMESVGIVEYLMEIDNPSPEIKRAIQSAAEWLDQVKIEGVAVEWHRDAELPRGGDRVVVSDPAAKPLWARFYEIGTNKPMYVGRDGIVHEHLADIEYERRVGYNWIGPFAADLLETKYPAWQKKWAE